MFIVYKNRGGIKFSKEKDRVAGSFSRKQHLGRPK